MSFTLKKKTVFFRQLSTMIDSALPIERALVTAGVGLLPQAPALAQKFLAGKSLSKCLASQPQLFSEYEVALIEAGETSGTLDTQLQTLASELEQTHQLVSALQAKLFYPFFVAHMGVLIPPVIVLVRDGPAAYFQVVLSTLGPLYLILGLLLTAYRYGSSRGSTRYLIDIVLAKVPVLGSALKLLAQTRYLRGLGHLLEAGILPDQAHQIASRACGNSLVRSRLQAGFNRHGLEARPSDWVQASAIFSPTAIALLASGEESGTMGPMAAKAAELLDMEYRAKVHLIATILPVLILMLVGLMVGVRVYFMLMKTYAPLFQL